LHYGLSQSFFHHLPAQEFRKKVFDPTNPETCLIGKSGGQDTDSLEKKVYIRYPKFTTSEQAELIFIENLKEDHLGTPLY
ncbi:hypothetical protein ACWKSR_12865, partial [Campylobacter fetus subsp. venerealis]